MSNRETIATAIHEPEVFPEQDFRNLQPVFVYARQILSHLQNHASHLTDAQHQRILESCECGMKNRVLFIEQGIPPAEHRGVSMICDRLYSTGLKNIPVSLQPIVAEIYFYNSRLVECSELEAGKKNFATLCKAVSVKIRDLNSMIRLSGKNVLTSTTEIEAALKSKFMPGVR